ncbi:MAG: alpha/beta fold hydrolase [Rhizobiaceae bacterium]
MTLTILQLSKPFGKIAFSEAGVGEPVVLIHGVGMQSAAWAPQIDALSKSRRVISIDMPGHGESDPLPTGSQLPDFIEWLHAALKAINTGPVSLAGHSMGALVSAGYAITYPEMVARVALLNGVYQRSAIARTAVEARAEQISAGTIDLETPLTRWFGDSVSDQNTRERVSGWLSSMDREAYAISYSAFARGDATFADQFHKISCPLLALTGDGDLNSSPAMSKAMARAAVNGRYVVISGHRHMVNLTAPEQVNAALEDWLKTPSKKQEIVDPRALRNAFGAFMTGVTVITTHDAEGNPLGFTANSFSSVSLDPPLVLACVANSSGNYKAFHNAKGFAVNILSESQIDVSNTFASKVENRFAAVEWKNGPYGYPVFEGVSAWFDCSMFKTVKAGDHLILIGKVEAFENSSHPGLGYARGAYVTPAIEAEGLSTRSKLVVSALIESNGKVLLIEHGEGHLTLPQMPVGQNGTRAALLQLITRSGVSAEPGFIYSVYEDEPNETQHISFLCQANGESVSRGEFIKLSATTLSNISDPAIRTMLKRFAQESMMGNFGVYTGNQIGGEVRTIASRS